MLLAILAAMVGANVAYHLASNGIWPGNEPGSLRFALMLLALMIAIIGGRVVPAFTHNWLHLNKPSARMPQRLNFREAAGVPSTAEQLASLVARGISNPVMGACALREIMAALSRDLAAAERRGEDRAVEMLVDIGAGEGASACCPACGGEENSAECEECHGDGLVSYVAALRLLLGRKETP